MFSAALPPGTGKRNGGFSLTSESKWQFLDGVLFLQQIRWAPAVPLIEAFMEAGSAQISVDQ